MAAPSGADDVVVVVAPGGGGVTRRLTGACRRDDSARSARPGMDGRGTRWFPWVVGWWLVVVG